MSEAICVWRITDGHSANWCGPLRRPDQPQHMGLDDAQTALRRGELVCSACLLAIRKSFMANTLGLLDKIRAKHDRLAAEEIANPRTEWPAGTILFEGGDDALPPRPVPSDALDEARALVDALRRKRTDSQLARRGYGKLDPAAFELETATADAERLLPALCDEFAGARCELAVARHELKTERAMSDYLRAEARADEVVKLTLEKIGLEEELALLREYHEASEALETLLSNAMWTAEADARLTAARTALAAWKKQR